MSPRRDECGAVAIVVALLTVTLMVLAGFVVDFGQAYVSKRNLQNASDAAALAAAAAFSEAPGDCEVVRSDAEANQQAQEAADRVRESNRPESAEVEFNLRCDAGVLVVEYESAGTTPSFFGPLAGAESSITTSRRAEASMEVGTSTTRNVRPLMLCSAEIPARSGSDQFVRVDAPGTGHSSPEDCPVPDTPGNWWVTDCPEERTGSASELATQIREGCDEGISIIPHENDDPTETLSSACPSAPVGSETCMSGNPGNISQGQAGTSWATVIETESEVIFPVFCAQPDCTRSTIDGSGTGAVFPVYRLASAVVCGYHFASNDNHDSNTGKCAGNPYEVGGANEGEGAGGNGNGNGNGENYLILKLTQVRTSGSYTDYECELGAACDTGLRRVRLTD